MISYEVIEYKKNILFKQLYYTISINKTYHNSIRMKNYTMWQYHTNKSNDWSFTFTIL